MGKISNKRIYETVTPTGSDYLIGTDAEDLNKTKNFKIQAIADFVGQNVTIGVGSLNALTGALTLVGGDGLTITDNGSDTITISMDRPDYIESINGLIGNIDIVGSTNITITDNGTDTITVNTQNLAKTNEANTFVNDQTMTKNLSVGTTVFNVDSTASRVGVNTANPLKSFDVLGDTIIEGLTGNVLTLKSPSTDGENYILFTNSSDSDKGWVGYRGTSNILQIDNLIDDIDISSLTGSVKLSLGASVKLQTTATGVDVSGEVVADSHVTSGGTSGDFVKGDGSLDSTDYQGQIDAEEAARIAADGVLQTNIDNEESARIAADSNLQSQVTNNTSDIATNTADIITNQNNIAANTSDIATNTSNISANTSNIATNTSNISTNASNISTNASNIATNASNIATNTADIITNQNNIAANTSDIATNTSNISANTSNIATNTSNIATNTSNIATNTSNIATNTSNIAINTSDITDLQNDKQDISEKGQANGYAPLDSGAKIPLANLPDSVLGQVTYEGTWNASTNTPALANPPASTTKGDYYVTSVAGTQFGIEFQEGDWIISNGTLWEKVDNTDAVTTVFGRIGPVVANPGDYALYYPPITRTISAGTGLTGGGDLSANRTISHDNTSSQSSVNNSGLTFIQDVTLDGFGHVTGLGSATVTLPAVNNSTITLSAGTGLSGGGDFTLNQSSAETITFNNTDRGSSQNIFKNIAVGGQSTIVADSNNDTLTFAAGTNVSITTNASTDTITINSTDQFTGTVTSIATGSGLTGGTITTSGTISHADTSSQGSVDNSGGTVIQDVTLDGFGHVTALGSVNLDSRYYTETEVNSLLSGKEDAFSKNTAFNKNFGTAAGTVAEGNHTHDASAIVSGTFANARISSSSVQQHVTKAYVDGLNVDADTLDGNDSSFFYPASNPNGYISSYTETDTLDSVTDRGATTTNAITVGGATINGNLTVNNSSSYLTINNSTTQNDARIDFNNVGTRKWSIDKSGGAHWLYFRDDAYNPVLTLKQAGGGATINGNLTVDTDTLFVDASSNRVGIGTDNPTWMLEVNKNTSGASVGQYPAISVNNPNASGYSAFYFFSGATNKGGLEFFNGDNSLRFFNGSERMRIDSSGNLIVDTDTLFVDASNNRVGIGTSIPQSKLEVVDGTGSVFRAINNGTNIMEIGNFKASGEGYQQLDISSSILTFNTGSAGGGSVTERMRIDSSGNVFVGTSAILTFGSSFSTNPYIQGDGSNLYIGTSNQARLTIDSSGNVGIGTSSPSNFSGLTFGDPILDVKGVIQVRGDATNGAAVLQFGGDTYRKASISTSVGTDSPYLAFAVATSDTSSGASERMRIDSSGNISIGTTTSLGTFTVNGGTTTVAGASNVSTALSDFTNSTLYVSHPSGNGNTVLLVGSAQIGFATTDNTTTTERMRIDSSGNVGIGTGTSSPSAKLEVVGDIKASGDVILGGTISTNSGTNEWDLRGSQSDVGLIVSTTNYIWVTIDGVDYALALVSNANFPS